jgi:hypothetical protein
MEQSNIPLIQAAFIGLVFLHEMYSTVILIDFPLSFYLSAGLG